MCRCVLCGVSDAGILILGRVRSVTEYVFFVDEERNGASLQESNSLGQTSTVTTLTLLLEAMPRTQINNADVTSFLFGLTTDGPLL